MSLADPSRYIATAVVPAVMISACGLLTLALYNRLSNIVSRLRALFRERLHPERQAASPTANDHVRDSMNRMLERESRRVLRRARLVRNALACLIVTIICMAICSLAGGLGTVWEVAAWLSLGLFVVGQLSLITGLGLALTELAQSLRPVEIESQAVERMLNSPTGQEESEV